VPGRDGEIVMSKQMADDGNSKRAVTAEELGNDTLEHVTGGRDESITIFREPTHHPSKVFIPS
jgi:hypothetical protein